MSEEDVLKCKDDGVSTGPVANYSKKVAECNKECVCSRNRQRDDASETESVYTLTAGDAY